MAECHRNAKGAFRIPHHFWCIRTSAGLTGNQAESKRARSGRFDLLLTCLLLRAVHLSTVHFAFLAIFAPRHALCCVRSPASLLLLPACCHLLSSPPTSAAAARLAKTRPEVIRVLEVNLGRILKVVLSMISNLERKRGQYQDYGFVRAKQQRNVASKSRYLRNV